MKWKGGRWCWGQQQDRGANTPSSCLGTCRVSRPLWEHIQGPGLESGTISINRQPGGTWGPCPCGSQPEARLTCLGPSGPGVLSAPLNFEGLLTCPQGPSLRRGTQALNTAPLSTGKKEPPIHSFQPPRTDRGTTGYRTNTSIKASWLAGAPSHGLGLPGSAQGWPCPTCARSSRGSDLFPTFLRPCSGHLGPEQGRDLLRVTARGHSIEASQGHTARGHSIEARAGSA